MFVQPVKYVFLWTLTNLLLSPIVPFSGCHAVENSIDGDFTTLQELKTKSDNGDFN